MSDGSCSIFKLKGFKLLTYIDRLNRKSNFVLLHFYKTSKNVNINWGIIQFNKQFLTANRTSNALSNERKEN